MNETNQEFQEITGRMADYIQLADDQFFQEQQERLLIKQIVQLLIKRAHELLPNITDEKMLNHALAMVNEATVGTVAFLGTETIWDEMEEHLNRLGYEHQMFGEPLPLPSSR